MLKESGLGVEVDDTNGDSGVVPNPILRSVVSVLDDHPESALLPKIPKDRVPGPFLRAGRKVCE
jgi:hypothetical protein